MYDADELKTLCLIVGIAFISLILACGLIVDLSGETTLSNSMKSPSEQIASNILK